MSRDVQCPLVCDPEIRSDALRGTVLVKEQHMGLIIFPKLAHKARRRGSFPEDQSSYRLSSIGLNWSLLFYLYGTYDLRTSNERQITAAMMFTTLFSYSFYSLLLNASYGKYLIQNDFHEFIYFCFLPRASFQGLRTLV